MASLVLWHPGGWDILFRLHRILRVRHVVLLWIVYAHSSNNNNSRHWPSIAVVQALSSPHTRNTYPLGMPPMPPARGGALPSNDHNDRTHPSHNMQHDLNSKTTTISSKCACGSLRIDIPIRYGPSTILQQHSSLMDCHCPACRRYHVSGLVRYLHVTDQITGAGDTAVRFRDSCDTLGMVDRTYCQKCSSKLLTTPVDSDGKNGGVYVNMGPIDDATVPDDLAEHWKQAPVTQWNANMAASWVSAQPGFEKALPPSRSSGGCTCGACQYDYRLEAPIEIQHCYCYLCRQLSGGLFMSWVPVKTLRQKFHWHVNNNALLDDSGIVSPSRGNNSGPRTHRYTQLGERHSCSACGGVLSILYDYEDRTDKYATIWLAAGGFDSIRFPFRIEPYLDRAVHICCRYKPKWFELPADGLDQIPDAA